MVIAEKNGYPIALHIESASLGESTLVEATIEGRIVDIFPNRLIGDKATTTMA